MNNHKLVPSIRFCGFTDDWEPCKLDDFGKATGGTSIESEFSEDGIFKVISIGSYSEDSTYRDQGIRAIKSEKTMSRVLKKDDITMILNDKTASGNIIGRVLLIDESGVYVYNQRTERIEVDNEKYSSLFIYVLLNAPKIREKIVKQSQGNTQIYVNWSTISNTDYIVPKIEEQLKIEAFLSNLDNLITFHQQKHDKLLNIKKAMLEKMFPKEGKRVPEVRFKGLTDDWEKRKLDECATFLRGSGLSWSDITEDGEYECILYGNLYTDYGMITTDIKYRTNTILTNAIFSSFGDVLIPGSDTTPTGLARATSIEKTRVLLGGDINIVRPRDRILGSCLSLAINANRKELIKLIKGTTVRHIHNQDLKDVVVSLPNSSVEQEQIVQLFKKLDNTITLQQRKIEKLKNIKKAMLEKMFV